MFGQKNIFLNSSTDNQIPQIIGTVLFVWSKVFTSAKSGCGASAGIYALIACILILYLQNPNLFNLDFGTLALSYLIWYFFLGNFIGLSGLIAHSLGFSFGIVGSMILLLAGVL